MTGYGRGGPASCRQFIPIEQGEFIRAAGCLVEQPAEHGRIVAGVAERGTIHRQRMPAQKCGEVVDVAPIGVLGVRSAPVKERREQPIDGIGCCR